MQGISNFAVSKDTYLYMSRTASILYSLVLTLLLGFTACQNDKDEAPKVEPMPQDAKPVKVILADPNCWIEGDQFIMTAMVDNQEFEWQRLWLNLRIIDAAQKPLLLAGKDTALTLEPHSPAVAPRGRSSFFWALPLSALNGVPDSFMLASALGVKVPAGAIPIVTESNGVKMLQSDPSDPTQSIEIGWQMNGKVESTLNYTVEQPHLDAALYGTDNRLYFTYALDMNRDTVVLRGSEYGPIGAYSKRQFVFRVGYESLPQPLRDKKIGRIDVMAFDKR